MDKNDKLYVKMMKNKGIIIGLILLIVCIVFSLLAPYISQYDPLETSGEDRLMSPSREHLMGTDQLGRDIMSRVLYGSRYSLAIGISVVVVSTIMGTFIGLISGYYEKIDRVIMRILDGFMAFPSIIIAITLAAIWGTGTLNIVLALSFANFTRMARVVRASVFSIKKLEYIDAGEVLGIGKARIIFRHILGNCFSPIIVQATFIFAISILDEAALSFLGVGIQAPLPSWGGMISEGRNFMSVAPWIILFPGGVMLMTVLGLNILGDGLSDILDPKSNR